MRGGIFQIVYIPELEKEEEEEMVHYFPSFLVLEVNLFVVISELFLLKSALDLLKTPPTLYLLGNWREAAT